MDLKSFFPYRLAVLAEQVSRSMAEVYAERFGITRDEWRVLAALPERGSVKTSQVIEQGTLEKMQVSRAVARLEERGALARERDPQDLRGQLLSLRPAGRRLLAQIAPLVKAREADLLQALSAQERRVLDAAMDKMLERVRCHPERPQGRASPTRPPRGFKVPGRAGSP
jgi:DNA-binding MarR family transcriptional regulator